MTDTSRGFINGGNRNQFREQFNRYRCPRQSFFMSNKPNTKTQAVACVSMWCNRMLVNGSTANFEHPQHSALSLPVKLPQFAIVNLLAPATNNKTSLSSSDGTSKLPVAAAREPPSFPVPNLSGNRRPSISTWIQAAISYDTSQPYLTLAWPRLSLYA
jgi:hypothetical protein